jgi:hypothetical protein
MNKTKHTYSAQNIKQDIFNQVLDIINTHGTGDPTLYNVINNKKCLLGHLFTKVFSHYQLSDILSYDPIPTTTVINKLTKKYRYVPKQFFTDIAHYHDIAVTRNININNLMQVFALSWGLDYNLNQDRDLTKENSIELSGIDNVINTELPTEELALSAA